MTQVSEGARPIRRLTPAQKTKLVRILKTRGERTLTAIAAECDVGVSTVYYWSAQLEKGVALDAPLPGPSEAITRSKPAAIEKPKPRLKQTEMFATVGSAEPSHGGALSPSERDELLLLRAEVTRLRRMVAASMM